MKRLCYQGLCLMIGLLMLTVAYSAEFYPFHNPLKRQQFNLLTHQLRCLVCQNEDIGGSSAPLAADLRGHVYQMVQQGQTNQQIKHYMVARYGDFVLFKPPVAQRTWLLWGGPFLLLLIGFLCVWRIARRYRFDAGGDTDA